MTLLDVVKQHFQSEYPWSRVLGHEIEGTTQIVVVGDLKETPVFMFTATPEQLLVEKITQKGDFEQVFAFEGDWIETGVITFVSLTNWFDLFPSVCFSVKEFERIGLGTETCEWEWMRDQTSRVFTHRVLLPKEESQANSDKLDRKGFKRMFERVLKVVYRGNKKLRSDVEHEWHKNWITEGEEK